MKLRFLGTGTSFGIPVLGCTCATCTSPDPHDRRTRHGALVTSDSGTNLLIDTPPELRLQLLAAGSPHIDAVWYTHGHADHVHGIDDLRAFSARRHTALDAWADAVTAERLRRTFDYIFDAAYVPPEGTTKPDIRLRTYTPGTPADVAAFAVTAFEVPHGDIPTYGFRVGDLGYVTDAKAVPEDAREILRGVRVLVLNALWFGNPHPTHMNVEEAIDTARTIGAERTYLTHLTHRLRHAELATRLPAGIEPAFDGLEIDV